MKVSSKALFLVAIVLFPLNFVYAESLTIGVAINDLNNPFFLQIVKGAKKRADEVSNGSAEMLVVDSGYDANLQRQQIRELVQRGADIIIVTAADRDALQGEIAAAARRGVRVVAVDVAASGAMATVTTDNVKAGQIACTQLAENLGGDGYIAIINGPNVSAVVDRVAGCRAALEHYPRVTVVDLDVNGEGSQRGGAAAMERLLQHARQLDAVFAINDPTAIGAEIVAQSQGRRKLVIASVDGAPIIQRALENSAGLIIGSAAQFPNLMAEKAVEIGYQSISGNWKPNNLVLIPPKLISKETAEQYVGWVQ